MLKLAKKPHWLLMKVQENHKQTKHTKPPSAIITWHRKWHRKLFEKKKETGHFQQSFVYYIRTYQYITVWKFKDIIFLLKINSVKMH